MGWEAGVGSMSQENMRMPKEFHDDVLLPVGGMVDVTGTLAKPLINYRDVGSSWKALRSFGDRRIISNIPKSLPFC